MSLTQVILVFGSLAAVAMVWPGALLRYGRRHHWISGYNVASDEEKEKYDIEGLSHHLGNGLITLGVLLFGASAALVLESMGWLIGLLAAFLFVAFIIVVGGQKFTPGALHPPAGESGHTVHRLARRLVSERWYRAMEAGTRQWVYECSCGKLDDYWDAGGIRHKAIGNRREIRRCTSCGKFSMQKVRRKRA